MRSAMPDELRFRVRIFRMQIAHWNANTRERQKKSYTRFPTQKRHLARRQLAKFVQLCSEQETSFRVAFFTGQSDTKQDIIAVIRVPPVGGRFAE